MEQNSIFHLIGLEARIAGNVSVSGILRAVAADEKAMPIGWSPSSLGKNRSQEWFCGSKPHIYDIVEMSKKRDSITSPGTSFFLDCFSFGSVPAVDGTRTGP
jgi:hypothetical protein